jgi:hypothetical protein
MKAPAYFALTLMEYPTVTHLRRYFARPHPKTLQLTLPRCQLGDNDIDFFAFCHRFCIMELKFLKFETVKISALKF